MACYLCAVAGLVLGFAVGRFSKPQQTQYAIIDADKMLQSMADTWRKRYESASKKLQAVEAAMKAEDDV